MYIYFKDIHDYGVKYYHINPKKQKQIKHIVEGLPKWIEYLGVFGSSLRTTCREDSDIDIIIIGEGDINEINTYGYDVDIVHYKSLDDLIESAERGLYSLEANIIREGVFVYDKEHA